MMTTSLDGRMIANQEAYSLARRLASCTQKELVGSIKCGEKITHMKEVEFLGYTDIPNLT